MIQIDFPSLNFPPVEIPLRNNFSNGSSSKKEEVFDHLRKKWVCLTPEEWVRQHFVRWMSEYLGYPTSFMANEIGITLNGRKRRCDTVVFTPELSPLMIIEYKAPNVVISQKVFDQIFRYNMVLEAKYLIVSNGLNHFGCKILYDSQSYLYIKEVPSYQILCNS